MKYILIIGDGMADNPLAALNGKTPLEHAKKPYIDKLSAGGILGSVRTIPEKYPPGSDTAIMSIFGCDPAECYSGRAPLEAAAQGVNLNPGDAAFRCNNVFISGSGAFEDKIIASHSAGGIDGAEASKIISDLFDTPEFKKLAKNGGFEIKPALSFRHIAVQRNADINGLVLSPPHDRLGEKVGENMPSGCANAQILTELMRSANVILENHPINKKRISEGKLPANGIWFWAEGTAAKLPVFSEKFEKKGAVISAVPLCRGIAVLTGMDVILVEGATGELDTNYDGKVTAALDALKTRDFAAVHIEAPDECTHNGDLPGKIEAIERLDGRVVAPLAERLKQEGEDFRMMILSDHKTLSDGGMHNGDPVPFILYDSRNSNGASGKAYSEKNGEAGPFVNKGTLLMPILFDNDATLR
ncbi:MAG: cofactor-independent phosphoglycerate mutase [Oscillospiraceae bacterium]|nr:cofactor-independent phosphoglycerate mutase [Oscillospiraceae bacterium]